jgi:phosphoenolpyruvate carboxylase
MSTQHPDNVSSPFFSNSSELGGEDEIMEAYYAFSHLGCDEQMWDCEGKEIDNYVIKKLLTKYRPFFDENRIGKDVFITLRVPNPTVEKAEAKILIETLESVPRSFDASQLIYKDEIPPIFEVILPMTTSTVCINRVYKYYRDYVVGKQNESFQGEEITIAQWIGKFAPETINVIPLVEDMESMLNVHNILETYITDKDLEYQRVFLARSDPALNYGLVSAVLINRLALQKIFRLSERLSFPFYPIIGVGSAPFRGNLNPNTVERVLKEYPSVQTFTIQSALKYDYSSDEVIKTIKEIKGNTRKRPYYIDEEKCLEVINKYSQEYAKQIIALAPVINKVAKYVPSRRKRKLHIGLFGYSRDIGDNIVLPRAITFTAALYSLGIPPEILGLNSVSDEDFDIIRNYYINFEEDLKDALKYFNPDSGFIPKGIELKIKEYDIDFEQDEEHKKFTDNVISNVKKIKTVDLSNQILMAATKRKFLG